MEEFKNQIDNMSDDDKNKIILQYLTIRKKANNQYNLTKKDDPEFIKKNRTFAKNYYINNKNKKLEYYEDNKSKIRIRARYNYYKNKDRLDDYILKYKEEAHNFLSQEDINKYSDNI
tara:strand:+ start:872 stop:1222 length:351 start_codon:yes stop_codon:yes gene_type:complete